MVGDGRFVCGVASGDPTATSLVLWARVDGEPEPVAWTLTDDDGAVQRSASSDRTIEVWCAPRSTVCDPAPPTVTGSARTRSTAVRGPGRRSVVAGHSPPGRPRSGWASPAAHGGRAASSPATGRWSTGISTWSCTWATTSTKTVRAASAAPTTRPHECRTLDDYDRRYAQYRGDPDLQALHAAAPWVATLDDHEIDDNVARFAPTGRSSGAGVDPERRRAGARRTRGGCRSGPTATGPRPETATSPSDSCAISCWSTPASVVARRRSATAARRPSRPLPRVRELLTDDQWDWLDDIVGRSTASWILLASQVQVAPLRLGWWPTRSGRVAGRSASPRS
jgi:alkaline phosphatase D